MLTRPTPQRIEELKTRGYTQKDIATIYGKRGRKGKIVENIPLMVLFYCLFAKDNNSTQQQIANAIFQRTGQKVSRFSVLRKLKQLGITRKKLTYHYVDQLKHRASIEEFKGLIPYLPQSKMLALDECSFHLNEAPRYGYAHRNLRANS
ncbi:5267_t:CDS:2 [Racocetra persica]|uniref:5267_t:CDS:1 n=1 Tax=Racocetra persica TaxID=160502 RepID=A0ACA9RQS8_9GLOM|nr:5267_t:CDS:2 [Racocetra persica]